MKETKVIYHEFSDKHRYDIVKYLNQQYGWMPYMMSANSNNEVEDAVNADFPHCIMQDSKILRQGKFDYSDKIPPVPIDSKILSSLAKYEINYLSNMADTTGWNFSFQERKSFYYSMIKYWNSVINKLKPEIVVFFTWPHTPTCHSLYLLCKHYCSIDVIFIDPVPLLNLGYHMIGVNLEELHLPFMNLYNSNADLSIGSDGKLYLSDVKSEKGKLPKHITAFYSTLKGLQKFQIKNFLIILKNTLKNGMGFKKGEWDWKKNRKPIYNDDSRMNHFEYFFFRDKIRRQNIQMQDYYRHLCVAPDYNKKYIYFAAPYQPEAVTEINAGVFMEILLALDILSTILPQDWLIYYKENPYTFDGSSLGSLKRDKYFYDKINSYKNIILVSHKIDTFTLIDNSHAVSTVSGTAAWEAVVRGKPALSFGNAWYMGCNSIFSIKALEDAQNAMQNILEGFEPDQNDIERYISVIEKIAIKELHHDYFDKRLDSLENPQKMIEQIGDEIYTTYRTYYNN